MPVLSLVRLFVIFKTGFGLKGPELIVKPNLFPYGFIDIEKQAQMPAFPA
jgi:hypothetical protein